jgi:anti-sigma regulatory factor (Ser/Thr protein kinase)
MSSQHLSRGRQDGGRWRRLHETDTCPSSPSSQVALPVALAAGRVARRFLDEHWCLPHSSTDLDRAHLLVSELVTNAVRHGGPPITLVVRCIGVDGVLLSVSDGSRLQPVVRQRGPGAVEGRGVHLVDALSAEWGVQDDRRPEPGDDRDTVPGPGKTVWCRLAV